MLKQCLVTTSDKPLLWQVKKAMKIAGDLERGLYVERKKYSLSYLRRQVAVNGEGADADIIVVTKERDVVYSGNNVFFFHPNMAELRVENLCRGQSDNMLEAMGLEKGMSVLDCTLGLASDAIVASWAVGGQGRVVGLESARLIYVIVSDGLQNFVHNDLCVQDENKKVAAKEMMEAMRRIEAVPVLHEQYLKKAADKSFDVVYFDPMFRSAISDSAGIKPLRGFANLGHLEIKAIAEARRVARKRIVVKEKKTSEEFKRLSCERVISGKYSSVAYGIIDL